MTFETVFVFPNLLALVIIIAGGLVRGYAGFGSGLVMVPLLAFLWDPVNAIILTLSLGLFATIQMTYPALKLANWTDIAPMIFAAIFVTPIGTFLLITLDPDLIKKIIAGIVLVITMVSLAGWSYKGRTGTAPSFLAGCFSAIINGIAAVGGPVYVIYLISLPDKPQVQRANMAMMTSVMGTSVLTYTLIAGDVDPKTINRIILYTIPYILSVWFGIKLFSIMPGESFKTIILWLLLIIVSGILIV